MGTSFVQQLEAFAYWRKRLTSNSAGVLLWGNTLACENRLMNQVPLLALDGQEVDYYLEAPLCGEQSLDLSAQYFATAFFFANPLKGRCVSHYGELFHNYARTLERLKPQLLKECNLYLEADTGQKEVQNVAAFVNLSGDFVEPILPELLAATDRSGLLKPVSKLLEQTKDCCIPWHFGFMDSREEKPLRLTLALKQGIKKLAPLMKNIKAPQLPKTVNEILTKIEDLNIFTSMLDLDMMPDGSLGAIYGIELIPGNAISSYQQTMLLSEQQYKKFCRIMQKANIADKRLETLPGAVFAETMNADTHIYSRISHFKLRWKKGNLMPAKVYLQMRLTGKQHTINQALGYKNLAKPKKEQENE